MRRQVHGRVAESPQFLHRIPRAIRDVAVLLEPMSVVEKGIDHAFLLQERMHGWRPRLGYALGAGPIGLLAAAVMRARGLRTIVIGREDATDLRAQIARRLGAEYISVANRTLADVVTATGQPDLVMEATGSAHVVFDATTILNRNGVLCLLSVTGGDRVHPEPIDRINQCLVLGNQVVFGSVNASARHFDQGVKDLATIERSGRACSRGS